MEHLKHIFQEIDRLNVNEVSFQAAEGETDQSVTFIYHFGGLVMLQLYTPPPLNKKRWKRHKNPL